MADTNNEAPNGGMPAPGSIRSRSSLFARGESMVWLTGAALVISVAMILGLLLIVVVRGGTAFWPQNLKRIETVDGRALMGELTKTETYRPEAFVFDAIPDEAQREKARAMVEGNDGRSERLFIRTGNRSPNNRDGFHWVQDFQITDTSLPEWALTIERTEWGRFYGNLKGFRTGEAVSATTPEDAWALFEKHHDAAVELFADAAEIEKDDVGAIDKRIEKARQAVRAAELDHGAGSSQHVAAQQAVDDVEAKWAERRAELRTKVDGMRADSGQYVLLLQDASGAEHEVRLVDIVRAYPANRLGWGEKLAVYLARWWEFLTDDPREANQEGGVWPAIFGTVILTLIMTILVVPFGVLGALYLREYAKQGTLVSIVRIAVNNLAGVPSIVFGVFGLGFFCYTVGAGIDQLFFAEKLPQPTYGRSGILWASLTLALLTLPVVIVATEEALAAVPNSMREGSYACGASKWQTIRRIVLPRAMPGVMTGMILAIARGAGEVAPIMLVGAAKMAPELPVDGHFPFIHPERSFMHLGFHIYDLGFQSPDAKAAEPLVFTTTLLLIGIVVILNIVAITIRTRLRRQFIEGA